MAVEKPDMRSTVEQWRSGAIKDIREKFVRRKIAQGSLYESIAINVLSSGDDLQKIQISFLEYGRFVDMGVGKGWPLGSRKTAALVALAKSEKPGKIRKRKPFYTRDIFHQGHVLHELLVEKHGIKMFSILENSVGGGKIKL